jgi:hypothetical protein
MKPIVGGAILSLFLLEYFYFINFLFNIYKKFDGYYVLDVECVDVCSLNGFEVWSEVCKLKAFQRVYGLFIRKKFSFSLVLSTSFIILLSIPFKFLKLVYYFIVVNKGSFREGIEIYYINLYYLLRDSKIEVLDRKIYLNCYTLGKLLCELKSRGQYSKQGLFSAAHDLKLAALNFDSYELKNYEYVKMVKTQASDDKGKIIYNYHYAYRFHDRSIHGTSNMPNRLTPFQGVDSSMPALIAKEARNPCSIIS